MILIEIVELVVHVDGCFQVEIFKCDLARGSIAARLIIADWIVVELHMLDYY